MKIVEKYSMEIENIRYRLERLEQERFYELSNAKSDGYLSTNIQNLRKDIAILLNKIENNSDSISDEIAKAFGFHSEE
ncbi:MAG: hypothetical protein SOX50_12565 [Terrisporobacter othiniensis]|uniref:hypothetical protein n=1 Tax=Terrisporobacter othiniensis TaxID=1577792 RepID=UPI002A750093|nr:hypothetical protein [Terrisporobacter othiniensis]MDY3374095.1 hypothetical protein [Terrisporobacter othiniensis]